MGSGWGGVEDRILRGVQSPELRASQSALLRKPELILNAECRLPLFVPLEPPHTFVLRPHPEAQNDCFSLPLAPWNLARFSGLASHCSGPEVSGPQGSCQREPWPPQLSTEGWG